MRAYVFIIMNICGIGGSEQYVFNKMKYLKEKGYDVYIYSSLNREILIADFKNYSNYIIPSLMYDPFCFKKEEVENTLTRIRNNIGQMNNYEEIIIESDGINQAKWSEMLAKKMKCKHIIFNVQETHNYTDEEISFLKFKLARNELFGITAISVGQMIKEEVELPATKFMAYCNNVVFDCEDKISSKLDKNSDYTLASIGRLEKEYVLPMIDELCVFFKINYDKKFNLLLIGGGKYRRNIYYRIKKALEKYNNVTLIITGALYPIPRGLLKKADVFISTSGSALVSYFEQLPTIVVHPVTGKPCGILGYNYDWTDSNRIYKELENETLHDLLWKILNNELYPRYELDMVTHYEERMHEEFKRQLSIALFSTETAYYDTDIIRYRFDSAKKVLYYLLGRLFGGKYMQVILEKSRKFVDWYKAVCK